MQTSGLAPIELALTGTLTHDAEVRNRVIDGEGHMVPVICMDLKLDNAHHSQLHSEQPFPVGQHKQAHAAAQRLKKDTRVTIQAPLVGVRLVAANTTHVHVIKPTEEAPTCPA